MNQDSDAANLTVSELMTTEVITIASTTTLQETIATMVRHGIRHLPVMEDGSVAAIVSDRNIRVMVTGSMAPDERRRYLSTTAVLRHATRPVTTIGLDATAAEAARVFVEQRIGCLPVVDEEGRLMGIVTQTDLLKWLASLTD